VANLNPLGGEAEPLNELPYFSFCLQPPPTLRPGRYFFSFPVLPRLIRNECIQLLISRHSQWPFPQRAATPLNPASRAPPPRTPPHFIFQYSFRCFFLLEDVACFLSQSLELFKSPGRKSHGFPPAYAFSDSPSAPEAPIGHSSPESPPPRPPPTLQGKNINLCYPLFSFCCFPFNLFPPSTVTYPFPYFSLIYCVASVCRAVLFLRNIGVQAPRVGIDHPLILRDPLCDPTPMIPVVAFSISPPPQHQATMIEDAYSASTPTT